MLYTIESMYHDLQDKVVVDLGTGSGMLAIGAALLGSPCVIGVDVDEDALDVALGNCQQFEDPLPIDFIMCDVTQIHRQRLHADTVIMNPPFGTKLKGADMQFLRAACSLRPKQIYSLNKSSTRRYIQKLALKELGCTSAEVLAELRYNLPATMKFHKQASVDIEVDLWRFELPAVEGSRAEREPQVSDNETDESD
eukprot:GHUV01036340.1.p2 GENE.GHUV01036340.1~~GHUV01036340.1.p2  ORF type:complete len:196 (+),score=32.46 GHUV01036340.1:223-810(+)